MEQLYMHRKEQKVTALMPTVSAVAALQVGEVIKFATGSGELLHRKVLFVDMLNSDFSWVAM